MENTWILVANASVATLYEYHPSNAVHGKIVLNLVGEFSHPDSRKKDKDLASDRQGAYVSGSTGHGTFVEASDPHDYEAQVFARELFHVLEQGRGHNKYQALILVAGPHFLGLMRNCIDDHPLLKRIPIQEVQKDYTQEKAHNLIKLLNL